MGGKQSLHHLLFLFCIEASDSGLLSGWVPHGLHHGSEPPSWIHPVYGHLCRNELSQSGGLSEDQPMHVIESAY